MKIDPAAGNVNSGQHKSKVTRHLNQSGKSFSELLKTSQKTATAPLPPADNSQVEYTVKAGDNLSRIAKQFNIKNPLQIAKDNKIANPDMIRPGQKLVIYLPQSGPAQAKTDLLKTSRLLEAQLLSTQPIRSQLASTQSHPAKAKAGVEMIASWYGIEFQNKPTASGQPYDMHKNSLAHNTLPLGTRVRLVNPENGKVAEGVINDRGPFIKGRDVDVSYAIARQLGFVDKGVTKLHVEILDTPTAT